MITSEPVVAYVLEAVFSLHHPNRPLDRGGSDLIIAKGGHKVWIIRRV
jgi:hypothetical protein